MILDDVKYNQYHFFGLIWLKARAPFIALSFKMRILIYCPKSFHNVSFFCEAPESKCLHVVDIKP